MQSNDICDYCKVKDCWSCLVGKDYHSFSGIEVAPVQHAKWIVRDGHPMTWECTKCGRRISIAYTPFNYCPDCGARMDGDK